LHEGEKILSVIFPSNQEPALPLSPGKEAFHQPAPLVSKQSKVILSLGFSPVSSMRRDHFNTVLPEFIIQLVTVIRPVTDQILRPASIM
jgi:hypothetical protein